MFSVEDSDIGTINLTQMEIKLTDNSTKLPFYSPRPLCSDLKAHIENLYNKGWIVNSLPSYPSPVVSKRRAALYTRAVITVH